MTKMEGYYLSRENIMGMFLKIGTMLMKTRTAVIKLGTIVVKFRPIVKDER